MNDNLPNGSNEHRIRQLERAIERLETKIHQLLDSQRPNRNPVAKLVQLPEDGVPGRDAESDQCVEGEYDIVWTNAARKIFVTGQTQKCRHVGTMELPGDGSRLAWALQHDDGFWHLHAYDCEDEGSSAISKVATNEAPMMASQFTPMSDFPTV